MIYSGCQFKTVNYDKMPENNVIDMYQSQRAATLYCAQNHRTKVRVKTLALTTFQFIFKSQGIASTQKCTAIVFIILVMAGFFFGRNMFRQERHTHYNGNTEHADHSGYVT